MENPSNKSETNNNRDPFEEIIEILNDYDDGFERDSKTDYEF